MIKRQDALLVAIQNLDGCSMPHAVALAFQCEADSPQAQQGNGREMQSLRRMLRELLLKQQYLNTHTQRLRDIAAQVQGHKGA